MPALACLMDTPKLVVYVVVIALAAVLVPMNVVLLLGLFDPKVDNAEVFKIVGPAYQTVVGAFVGILSGYVLGKGEKHG